MRIIAVYSTKTKLSTTTAFLQGYRSQKSALHLLRAVASVHPWCCINPTLAVSQRGMNDNNNTDHLVLCHFTH